MFPVAYLVGAKIVLFKLKYMYRINTNLTLFSRNKFLLNTIQLNKTFHY